MEHSQVEKEAWTEIRDTTVVIKGEMTKVKLGQHDPAQALILISVYMNRIVGALKMLKGEGL